MNATITVDKAGRIVLPKALRDELELAAGDSLELETSEDQIVLRPLRGNAGMRKKMGVWVFSLGRPVSAASVDRLIERMRLERGQIAPPLRRTGRRRSK